MSTETLSRRGLLRGAGVGAAAAALPLGRAAAVWSPRPAGAAPLLPLKELDGLAARVSKSTDPVAHLLHRTTFGVRPGDLERAREMGAEAWLDEQLHPERIDDTEVEARVAERFPTLAMSPQELYDVAQEADDGGYSVAMELKRATLYRALYSRRQLFEVTVQFWNNHFSMYHFKDYVSIWKTVDDREVSRRHAFGPFREILLASAHSPAMMIFLDNEDNVADGPNENYARELMELHTIGVDAGYTQADVRQVARCFTGWTVNYEDEGANGDFLFADWAHDPGPKRVLGVAIAGGDPGVLDGRRVLETLARHPACARFISAKLCRHFVADTPPASLVTRAAAAFTATGGDVRAVLRTILLADEFASSADQKLRRPYEFLVAALRALVPAAPEVTSDALDSFIYSLYPLGQVPFDWEPPNGYPDVGAAWANTNGLLGRWNLASALVLNWFDGAQVPVRALVARSRARTPGQLVDALASLLLQRTLDPADRARLAAYVAPGRPADARVPAWLLNRAAPGLLALILGSPYFQWR